jgi:hypothetical protein
MQTTQGDGPRGARRSASFQWQLEVLAVPPLSRAGERRKGVLLGCDVRDREGGDGGGGFFSVLNFELDAGFFVEMKEEKCQICLHT